METVLLLGFEPFDRDLINPSWEAVRLLDGVQLQEGVTIVARQLPCAFATAGSCLNQLLAEHQPQLVIATGLGPGRSDISIERVAINLIDARIPDNLGAQPVDTAVTPRGACCLLQHPAGQGHGQGGARGRNRSLGFANGGHLCM